MEIFGYKIFKKNTLDNIFFNRDNFLKYFFDDSQKLILFDVGANIGQTVKFFIERFENYSIHAFEPSGMAFESLSKAYSNHKNVRLNKLALGRESSEMELNCYSYSAYNSFYAIDPDSFIVKNKVYKKTEECAGELEAPKKEIVAIDTLDNYCLQNDISKIDILKIDVQGFEAEVLLGTSRLLADSLIDMLIIEVTFDDYYKHSTSFYDIESILLKKDYMLWDISHIYKDIKRGRTCWVDAVYVSKKKFEARLSFEV